MLFRFSGVLFTVEKQDSAFDFFPDLSVGLRRGVQIGEERVGPVFMARPVAVSAGTAEKGCRTAFALYPGGGGGGAVSATAGEHDEIGWSLAYPKDFCVAGLEAEFRLGSKMPPAALVAISIRTAVGPVSLPAAVSVHAIRVFVVGPVGVIRNFLFGTGGDLRGSGDIAGGGEESPPGGAVVAQAAVHVGGVARFEIPAFIFVYIHQKPVVEVVGIHADAGSDLLLVRKAGRRPRGGARRVERRQQHGRQNRDDRDYDYDHLLNIQYGVY